MNRCLPTLRTLLAGMFGPAPVAPDDLASQQTLGDLRRAQKTMILARFLAVPWAVLEVLTRALPPYPPGWREVAFVLVAALAAGNVAVWAASRQVRTAHQARALALAGLGLDLLVACGFVLVHTFAHTAALWAVLFILPLEGAILFNLGGALCVWGLATAFYVGRDCWGSGRYGYVLSWNSIGFRMGIALFIAIVAGLMARDLVRERRRLAEALGQLGEAQHLAKVGSWEWDIQADQVRWSSELYRIFAMAPDEFEGTYAAYLDRVHADDRQLVEARVRQAVDDCADVEYEHRIAGSGSERIVYCRARVVAGADGSAVRLVGIAADTTERRHIERNLRASEQRVREIIETAHDAFVAIDAGGRIVEWNPQAEATFGWAREAALGRSLADTVVPPAYRQAHVEGLERFLATGEGQVLFRRVELSALHADGRQLPVELTIWPTRSAEGWTFNAFVRDIAERKRSEMFVGLLKAVAVAANEASSLEEALQRSLDEVCAQAGWPVGHAYVCRDKADRLVPTGIWHLDDAERFEAFRRATEETVLGAGEGLPGRVLSTGRPAWIADVLLDENFPRARAADAANLGVRAAFAFPVLAGSRVAAVLEFFSPSTAEPDAGLLDLMAHLGSQLGRVVEREEAFRLHERLALTDELTGLHNRRGLITLGQQQLELARRLDLDVTAVFVDVNDMKAINDTFGHAEGDAALCAVAGLLRDGFRSSDVVARVGGDEFCVLQLGGDDGSVARLRAVEQRLNDRPGRRYRLALSVGAARFDVAELPSMEELVQRADLAMYEDKRRSDRRRPLVLMVEDDPSLCELAAVIFEDEFTLTTAATGADALALATAEPPDLILLDLGLPDLPGSEVARRLRAASETSRVPLMMVTGNGACEAESLQLGVDDYVRKPFDEEVLRARMRNLLARSSRRQSSN